VLWARSPEVAEEVDRRGRNSRYLGDFPLTDGLRATDSLEQAVQDADVVVMGVPSHGFRGVLEQVVSHVRPWIPVVSLVGLQIPLYIGGSVIIEAIFRLPGVGLFFFEALTRLDYPVVQSVNLIFAAMVVGLNLAIDLTYAFLDPRIRY